MPDRRRFDTVLASKRSEIPRLAEIVRQFGAANHLSVDDIMRVRLVLDEIVVNIVAHGYEDAGDTNHHDIQLHLALDDRDVLTIRVTDDAREYDPRTAPAPRSRSPTENGCSPARGPTRRRPRWPRSSVVRIAPARPAPSPSTTDAPA